MPKFDRIPRFDERSRNYPIRALITEEEPRTYIWNCSAHLDQGNEGACVGFGWTHEAAAVPVEEEVTNEDAFALYRRAQQIDEWPGEDYDGTSVLAGAKAAVEKGWMSEYRWAFGLEDALLALSWFGPLVIGVNWYAGMIDTDTQCYIKPYGSYLGGHCVLVRGIEIERRLVVVHNSWGENWGGTKYGPGTAYLTWMDFDKLLKEQGEACIPLVRRAEEPEPEPIPVPVPPEPEPTPEPEEPEPAPEPEPKCFLVELWRDILSIFR